jgi:hypothetical protein
VLWAGAGESDPGKAGRGCFRARLFEADVKWQAVAAGWTGGTCWDLEFQGSMVVAATQSGGVLRLDADDASPQWRHADVNGGLPLRDRTRFEPVETVASIEGGQILAGGPRGVYRSVDAGRWTPAANRTTDDMVTVPETWLLCSGDHDIEVVRDGATTVH